MANEKILVVDDDTNICELLRLYLTKEGYQVTTANDGEEGLDKFNQVKPDMVLLDVMMPKMDGLEVCRRIRKAGNTPVLMLTAKGETFDKVLGLELGADDYLAKPFGMRELVARVRALLRRTQNRQEINEVSFDNVSIDFRAYKAERDARPLELSAREYRLLRYLVAKHGTVVTRDELLDEVWGYNSYPTTRTVDNHIARLRAKIEENVEEPRHILTVHGVGYKFVA